MAVGYQPGSSGHEPDGTVAALASSKASGLFQSFPPSERKVAARPRQVACVTPSANCVQLRNSGKAVLRTPGIEKEKPLMNLNPAVQPTEYTKHTKSEGLEIEPRSGSRVAEKNEKCRKRGSSAAGAIDPAGECSRLRKALGFFGLFRFFRLNCCF